MKAKLKILCIVAVVLIIVNPCHSQLPSFGDLGFFNTYKENKFYWGLSFNTYGKVKSISQTKYKLENKSGKLIKGRKIGNFDNDSNFIIKFDEYGNIIESVKYSFLVKTEISYTYNYDDNGNIIEVRGYNPDSRWVSVDKYQYDNHGKLIEEEFFYSNIHKKCNHTYDDKDNVIETNCSKIHLFRFIDFLVDVFLIDDSESDENKNVFTRIMKSYDENQNLIKEVIYESRDNNRLVRIIETYTCEYDNNGKITKEFKKLDGGVDGKSTIEMKHYVDDQGYKSDTELNFDIGGLKMTIYTKIIRDLNGLVVEINENQITPFNKINYNEKFEYDSNNNVSKIYFFKNDKPKFIIERDIHYY